MKTKQSQQAWLLLLTMVLIESFSTMMLKQSDGLQNLVPTLLAFSGYFLVLFLFSYVLKSIPASLAYAVWTGLGTLLVVVAGWFFFAEALTLASISGIALIVFGVILINRQETIET
ncbi:DMT family transporter [Aeromonas veronii]|uniref:DMT family transporter n=1 Tax=Aeromonas TaxID=642 RepID=UPI001D0A1468|nr:multidrug efflux SMR transporter [Aeromonas veronii]MCX9114728.1 multidrug efflux SMR transporter [Aeromonas veronii]UDN23631.1 multidrug efflux SMR transporter [Aeromonas veronii]